MGAAKQQLPQHPIFDTVETAALPVPVEVEAHKGQQAGYDIFGACCPRCHPNGSQSVHDWIWLNKPGRIVCRCGTHLKLTHPDFPDEAANG